MVLALLKRGVSRYVNGSWGYVKHHAHSTRDPVDISPPGLLVDRDDADLDTEVLSGFEERCMCRGRYDPRASQQREGRKGGRRSCQTGDIHFRRGDAFGRLGPVSVRLDGHKDGFGTTGSRYRDQSGV